MFFASRSDHVTPLLRRLHWLRAPKRIVYKLALLAYRSLHGLAPVYLAHVLHPVTDLPGRRRLRSASSLTVAVPSTRPRTVGDRAFLASAHHGHGTLFPQKSHRGQQCQHLNLK